MLNGIMLIPAALDVIIAKLLQEGMVFVDPNFPFYCLQCSKRSVFD